MIIIVKIFVITIGVFVIFPAAMYSDAFTRKLSRQRFIISKSNEKIILDSNFRDKNQINFNKLLCITFKFDSNHGNPIKFIFIYYKIQRMYGGTMAIFEE